MSGKDALAEGVPISGEVLESMAGMGPCELREGRIVRTSPTGGEHARVEWFLGMELGLFERRHRTGRVLVGEVGIYTHRNPDSVRAADVAFISRSRAPGGPRRGYLDIPPELVVEIVSPSDRAQDLQEKLLEYLEAGVEQVWVVDPAERTVTVHRGVGSPRAYGLGERLVGEGVLNGFELDVSALFQPG